MKTKQNPPTQLTVVSKVQLFDVSRSGDKLAQSDAHVDDEQTDGGVQQEVDHVPGAGIALEQRRQVNIRHVNSHRSDALLRRVIPPNVPGPTHVGRLAEAFRCGRRESEKGEESYSRNKRKGERSLVAFEIIKRLLRPLEDSICLLTN